MLKTSLMPPAIQIKLRLVTNAHRQTHGHSYYPPLSSTTFHRLSFPTPLPLTSIFIHPYAPPLPSPLHFLPQEEYTHTHLFNGPLSRTTRVSRYQKGTTNLDFTEARDSEWQWHQLGHRQVCTSLQTDNHASNPPLRRNTWWGNI